jgi:hypothetical protein
MFFRMILFISLFFALPVTAATVTVDAGGDPNEVLYFRDFRGTNSVGLAMGDRLVLGFVDVQPAIGTTITARYATGDEVALAPTPSPENPNAFTGSVPYNSAFTGSWSFSLQNGPDETTVTVPAIGDVPQMGRTTDLLMFPDGLEPRFEWTNPAGAEAVQITVLDLGERQGPSGFAERIAVFQLPPEATSFEMPAGILQPEKLYSLEIAADLTWQGGLNPSGSSRDGAIASRSRTFFDFPSGNLPDVDGLYLPTVDTTGDTPVFNFDNAVVAGVLAFYDPVFAVGYEYQIGFGDPRFASVLLPDIGTGSYDLFLHDGSDFYFEGILDPGVQYTFDGDGVDRFRILGIDVMLGLDPGDPTAFVTGLSFTDDGRFTGTMTPIVAPIPLPAGWALVLGAFALLVGAGRKTGRPENSLSAGHKGRSIASHGTSR